MAFSYFAHSFMNETSSSVETYVGVVSSKQKTFGFIRSQLPTDTFFHQTACGVLLFGQLNVGDAVCFQLDQTGSKPGKRVACYVARSAQQPALQHVSTTQHYGRLVKLPVACRSGSGVLRYVPAPGKIQHLTFGTYDLPDKAAGAQLVAGQTLAFRVLTDQRRQQLPQPPDSSPSPYAVHGYKHATQVKAVTSAQVALLPPEVQQQLAVLDAVAAMFDDDRAHTAN